MQNIRKLLFFIFGKKIEKEKEDEFYIYQIINKKNKRIIFI